MDVFDVGSRLIDDYKAFTTSTVDIADPRVRQYVSDQLDGDRQWPEPWLSLNPAFASGGPSGRARPVFSSLRRRAAETTHPRRAPHSSGGAGPAR